MAAHECQCADAIRLLVGVRDVHDVAREVHARALERDETHELDDALSLHVERAAAPQVSILDHATEWIGGPALARHRYDIHVVHECDALLGPSPLSTA